MTCAAGQDEFMDRPRAHSRRPMTDHSWSRLLPGMMGGNQAVILPRLSGLARQGGAIPTCWGRGSDEDTTTGAEMQWNLLLQRVAVAAPGTDVNSDTSSLTTVIVPDRQTCTDNE